MTTEELIKALREKESRDNRWLLDEAAERLESLQKRYDLAVAEREANVKGFMEMLKELCPLKEPEGKSITVGKFVPRYEGGNGDEG